jgi:GNAT superfamily N-acetyltransferase
MLVLRRAAAGDVSGIMACISAAYAKYRAAGIDLPPVADGVAEDVRDNQVWVALAGGKLAGVLVAVAGADHWHLANLAVDPGFGGRGVARRLLACFEDGARQAGVLDLVLTTHIAMPDNVAIYAHLGWSETGREGNKVFMARRLDATEQE